MVLSIDGLLWWQIEYKDTSSFLFKIYQKTNQRYFCKGRDKANRFPQRATKLGTSPHHSCTPSCHSQHEAGISFQFNTPPSNPAPLKQSKIPYHQPHPPQKKALIKLLINNLIKAFWVLSNDEVSRWQIEYKEYLSFLFKIIFKLIKDIFERR